MKETVPIILSFILDEHPEYKRFFESTKDVESILQNLMMASGEIIKPDNPEDTLIVFDEIQECPNALNTLKYFCENTPHYHVACAGSLLGIALSKPVSFPVGKVDFLEIMPMTFTEFLMANGDSNFAAYMNSVERIEPIPEAFFNPLYEKLKMYFVTGGMPESVRSWTQDRDVELMQRVLSNILGAYERDFAKHPDPKDFPKISLIWRAIPSQLARENKKFIYKVIKEKYSDKVKLRIRFSLNNLRLDDDLLNIPLFMADYTDRLIGMALGQVK